MEKDPHDGLTVVFYGCFLVIEAQGGRCFRTPYPNCQRSRHTSVSGSAPTSRTGSVCQRDAVLV